jgi:hypothetical protein
MWVHVFRSGTDEEMTGFTQESSGGNLPASLAPWQPCERAILQMGDGFGGLTHGAHPIVEGIQRQGFVLADAQELGQA